MLNVVSSLAALDVQQVQTNVFSDSEKITVFRFLSGAGNRTSSGSGSRIHYSSRIGLTVAVLRPDAHQRRTVRPYA